MGGPCLLIKVDANGKHVERVRGPACTDNFQIIKFEFEGDVYYSAEQCFQAQKFKAGSKMRVEITKEKPAANESDHAYGMRVWGLGQSRSSPLRENYEEQKVKLMFLINLAKYACNASLQKELVDKTQDLEIVGAASTWSWSKWNGLIQMLIRQKIKENQDLKKLLAHYSAMAPKDLDAVLEGTDVVKKKEQDEAKQDDNENNDEQKEEAADDKGKTEDK